MRLVASSYAPDTVERDHGWREYALCAETDPEIFYPADGMTAAPARAICMGCEVRAECLQYALGREKEGVWGGMSAGQRKAILAARTRHTTIPKEAS
ncbi:WhiB family transcriptional regulator [Streptomyces niveus]|uniref:WhiB family transcriptional regulator n=1 Tax=Streptomyces niveus TaxID=193462 RepID=UPI0034446259